MKARHFDWGNQSRTKYLHFSVQTVINDEIVRHSNPVWFHWVPYRVYNQIQRGLRCDWWWETNLLSIVEQHLHWIYKIWITVFDVQEIQTKVQQKSYLAQNDSFPPRHHRNMQLFYCLPFWLLILLLFYCLLLNSHEDPSPISLE